MSTSIPAADGVDKHPRGKTFFGHPGMLANLFTVEMWERFSFYGMQGLMLYYLYYTADQGGLGVGLDKTDATGIVGAYGAVVYLMSILGGVLGDRILGPERTLFYSAITIMAGHIALAVVPGVAGVVLGLLLVAIGSGCLKTNAVVLVSSLYKEKDPKRDSGFTIFYIGVNIGALIGPLLTGIAWEGTNIANFHIGGGGFHMGFGLAAIGMAAGLTQYWMTRSKLPESVHHIANPMNKAEKSWLAVSLGALIIVIAVLVGTGLFTPKNLKNWVLGAIFIGALGLFIRLLSAKDITATERSRVSAFIPLWFANAIFWGLYQQQFTVVGVYSEERLDWASLGLAPNTVNSISPIFIIILGTGFATLWTKLGDRQPGSLIKFSSALVILGLGYLLFLTQAGVATVSLGWIVFILFVITIAELAFSPVGQSLVSQLAPEKHKSDMMALYWTSVSMGTALSGWFAQFYKNETEVPYFSAMGSLTIGAGIVLFFCRKPIQKLMAGVK